MPIIIRIGRRAIGLFWALTVLLGVFLMYSGFFGAIAGSANYSTTVLANNAATSQSGVGIAMFIVGLGLVAAGSLGIRGKIIIALSEKLKNTLF